MKMRYPALLLTCILITACDATTSFSGITSTPPPAGGGGDGGGGGGSGGGGGGPLTITSANAMSAAGVAIAAAFQSGSLGDIVGPLGLATANVGNMNKVSGGRHQSATLFKAIQKVPFGPFDQPCLLSGMITISGDLADPLGLTFSVGDVLTVVAADCDDGLGEVVNGTIDYAFTTITGDILAGPPYRLVIDVDLTNLQVTDSSGTRTANGSASVSIDTTTDPVWSVSINGPMLMTDTATVSQTISNFDMTQTVDTGVAPTPYTMDSNGTVDSTQLNGTVGYSTPLIFDGSGTSYPYAGEFLVAGASNSSIRLIALDEVNVRLESDFDGDGAVDETTDTTWDALIAQANP